MKKLATFCVDNRRVVFLSWFAILAAVILLTLQAGGNYSDDLTIPGSETDQATMLLNDRLPGFSGGTATLVFRSDSGFDDGNTRQAVQDSLAEVEGLEHFVSHAEPFAEGATSSDGTTILIDVQYDVPAISVGADGAVALEQALEPARAAGIEAESGGEVPFINAPTETGSAEIIGLVVALLLLWFLFRSVIAAVLPVMVAIIGLIIGLALLTVLSDVVSVPTVAPAVASMVGIGVGIDYSLLLYSRYRRERKHRPQREAAIASVLTAGVSVIFAGGTVMVAILGLFFTGIFFVGMLGVGASMVVGIAVALSVTLVPALLVSLPEKAPVAEEPDGDLNEGGGWEEWGSRVVARPWPYLLASLAILAVIGAPALTMRQGMPDAGSTSTDTTARRAYDLITEEFGPGFNGPLAVVIAAEDPSQTYDLDAASAQILGALQGRDGLLAVQPAATNPAGDLTILAAIPTTSPSDQLTAGLVRDLRTELVDDAASLPNITVLLAGSTAGLMDLADNLASRAIPFIAGVVGLSFVLLMVAFRSIVVPLKAVILNILSIVAAYGVIVVVFEWGWGRGFIGLEEELPIVSFIPVFMFAVLFGLSMDYHVFMLSRIREEYLTSHDSHGSVSRGLAGTAKVITAAALVMIFVFGSFAFSSDPTLKMLGLGLAAAIFIDAFLVRITLVPASMALLGDWNWWLPPFLDRILPELHVEGSLDALDGSADHTDDHDDLADSGGDRPVDTLERGGR